MNNQFQHSNLINPFPGLRAFKGSERSLFFGREEHVLDVLNKLEKNHFEGISSNEINDNLFVNPNPFQSEVYFSIPKSLQDYSQMIIIDALGRIILENKLHHQEKIQLDLSMLEAGIYTLQLFNNKQSINTKLIKQE